jgi:hypothetical protein
VAGSLTSGAFRVRVDAGQPAVDRYLPVLELEESTRTTFIGYLDVGAFARSAHRGSSWSGSAITRWATRKALFAAGTPQ